MSLTASMLVLGTRGDALRWREGCRGLGMAILPHVREPRPRLRKLKDFARSTPDWIFFGGHFDNRGLFNDRELWGMDDTAVVVKFLKDRVRVRSHGKRAILRKDRGEFALHSRCKVTFWGGCNVASNTDTVATIMRLFGPHLLIGFAGTTSPYLVSAVIGSKQGQGNFFGRLGSDPDTLGGATVREAWFDAVRASKAARRTAPRYRVVDETGQEWRLKKVRGDGLEVVTGRRISI